jgi:hypothetical protein
LIQNFRYEFFNTSILKINDEDFEQSKFISGDLNLNLEIQKYLSEKFNAI